MNILRTGILGETLAEQSCDDANIRLVRYKAGQIMPRHAHDWAGVTLVVSGNLSEHIEGRMAYCSSLTLVVKPSGAEHETRTGPNGALTVHFGLNSRGTRALAQFGVDMARCGFLVAGPATAALLEIIRGVDRNQYGVVAEVLAGAIRSRRSSDQPNSVAASSEFEHMKMYGSTRVAATIADMHPVSFARRFRRMTGWSPSRWRLHDRVTRAADALVNARESIAKIAHRIGFADHAHLCRTFRRETGLTPSQYRKLVRDLFIQDR